MRKPYARTPSSKEIDRRVCFETTSKKGVLCASPYAQTLGGLGAWGPWGPWGLGRRRAWAKPSLLHPTSFFPPPFYHPKQAPYARPYAMTLGYVGASGPSSLPPPSSLQPSSLLLQPAKPYARPYARYKFDDSGLCWRSRPLPPPSSVLLSTPKTDPLCAALCAPYARPLCAGHVHQWI